MKDKFLTVVRHPMVGGSSIIFIGTLSANVINYIFNLLMGRLLSVSDYGLMVSLNSLFVLFGIFGISFVNLIAKFSAKYHSTDNKTGIYTLISYGSKFIIIFSSILLLILLLLTPVLGKFLKIENFLYIFLIEGSIFFALLMSLPSGFFQGALRFYSLTTINLVQPIIRLVVAVALIFAGYAILGPLVGIALSGLIPIIICYTYVFKRYRTKHEDNAFNIALFKKEFFHFTYTYFLSGIGLTLLSNSDILLVRHFFNPEITGQYAALSLMGKAILYFTTPIGTVFFPFIAQKKERKEKLFETVLLASSAVVGISALLSAAYFIVPDLVLKVFFPKPSYHVLVHYLGFYSLYILVFSFASLLNSYFLSIGKTKVYMITLIAAAIQIGSILLFHNNLFEIIAGLFTASLVMLLLLIIYFIKNGEDI
jgi:O-antigen/teichoic acid export membrane protein